MERVTHRLRIVVKGELLAFTDSVAQYDQGKEDRRNGAPFNRLRSLAWQAGWEYANIHIEIATRYEGAGVGQ